MSCVIVEVVVKNVDDSSAIRNRSVKCMIKTFAFIFNGYSFND